MRIEKRRWEDVTVLDSIGEFDAFNLESFSARIDTLIETGHTKLAFNLRLLTFVNSAALGYLIRTKKLVEERGGNLVLVQPSKFVMKTLLTLGLDELFEIFETDVDAMRYFHGDAEVSPIDLKSLPIETDEELIGAGAIIFRPADGEPPVEGAFHRAGRILSLDKEGPVFQWKIPGPDEDVAAAGITTESFDRLMTVGTLLRIKVRQPLAVKSHFLETEARIAEVVREEENVARIRLVYTRMDPDGPFPLPQGAPLLPTDPADSARAKPEE
jgi:anti-sigma B factor antagonist